MICPRCHGTGMILVEFGVWQRAYGWEPCLEPGCHAGRLHCCDGEQEQPQECQREWRKSD